MNKSPQNHQEKEKNGFWLLNPASKIESLLLIIFFVFLPTQFGKHFWPDFSVVSGIRIDYLSSILYTTDVVLCLLFGAFCFRLINQRLGISTTSLPQAKDSLTSQSQKRKNEINKAKKQSKKLFFSGALFLLFVLANILFATRPLLSLYGWVKFLELLFLALYLAKTIRYRFQLRFIALLFAIGAALESLLAIFQYLNQGSLNGIFYFFGERAFTGATPGIANASIGGTLVLRPYATFSHPNVLAGYLLVSMVLVWSLLLKNNTRWMQIIAGVSLLLSSIALLLTFGRVAIVLWAALLIFIFVRLLFQKVKSLRSKVLVIGSVLVVLGVLGTFHLSQELSARFYQTSLFEQSVTERTELLSASAVMIQKHPILGVGQDNFIPALAPLQKPLPLGLYLQPVHNIFVLITAQTGVIGLGLFFWLLGATYIKIMKPVSDSRNMFFILFLIILITGLFDHYWLTLQQGQLIFATVLGLSWAKFQKSSR